MINTSTISFSGFAKRMDKACENLQITGTMNKVNNRITSGTYKLKSNKTNEFVSIPFTINGHVDENGYLNIQTWEGTYIKGLLQRNTTILCGFNHKKTPIEWHITFQ
jgi:hypothetical protein